MSTWEEAVAELNNIALAFDTSGPYVAAKIDKITVATAHLIEANAKQIVAVDTGATRSSIGTDIERHGEGPGYGVEATIGPTTSYAPHLEFGTERMAPRAFMGPSLDRFSGAYVAALDEATDPLAGRP
jgi:HK97 gp10 family phage protein